MKTLFKAKFSEKGSNIRAKEEQAYIFLGDFMDECEGTYATLNRIESLDDKFVGASAYW